MALACWLFPFKVNAVKKGVGEKWYESPYHGILDCSLINWFKSP